MNLLHRLICDRRGVAATEFALALPLLLMLTLGIYDMSRMVALRIDYQQALTEATSLALARPPQGLASVDLDYLVKAAAQAARVPESSISAQLRSRCNGVQMPVGTHTCPNAGDEWALYVTVAINSAYVPRWTDFGLGQNVQMNFARTVRIR